MGAFMKKVAIFTRGLSLNGANKSLIELLKRLDYSKLVLDLYVLNYSEADNLLFKQIPNNVNIIKVKQYDKSIVTLFNIILHPIHFFRAIKSKKNLNNKCFLEQFKATAERLPKVNKVYDIAISYRHLDIDVFFVKNNMYAKKKFFWIHGVQQLEKKEISILENIYQSYDKIFPVSNAAKNNILKYFPSLKDKCKVAYCIVDADEINKLALEGESFIENDIFNILTIGRLNEEKGIDLAIEACEILKKDGFRFKWYVCGDGNQKDYLKSMIRDKNLMDHFILLGNIDNPYGYLKNCDIYVQPSYMESYCLTINEAKILNKSIVCTKLEATEEQIEDGINGILTKLTATDLANGIKKLMKNNLLRNQLTLELSKYDYSHDEALKLLMNEINIKK